MKKSLLILSSLAAVTLPIAAVVSCSGLGKSKSSTPWSHLSFATTVSPKQGSTQSPQTGNTGTQNQVPTQSPQPGNPVTQNQGPTQTPQPGNPVTATHQQPQTPVTPPHVPTGIPWTTIPTTPAATIGIPWTTIPTTPAATISVPWTAQTKPIIVTPKTTSPQTPPHVGAPATNVIDSSDKALTTFNITTIKENPNIGFLPDVDDTIREFRCYDNGLFKIKIETTLIGTGKYFASNDKADMEAVAIASSINIGPAITHLPKGIQVLNSDSPASLGGPDGVQISESNQYGSADDVGIKNEASLVDHEYGHHETMWDYENILGGSLSETPVTGMVTMKEVAAAGLKAAGYDVIAKIVAGTNPDNSGKFGFTKGLDKDFPAAYGIAAGEHKVFDTSDYPFSSPEIITRMLNALSCRTDLTAKELYTPGLAGKYPTVGGKTVAFEPPAAFVSDATIRHWSGDSVFGSGKDATRIDKLIEFYEKEIFGLGKGNITLTGDPNDSGTVTGIELSTLGALPNLETLEVVDAGTGKTVASTKATTFNSRMGFKNELVSNTWTTRLTVPVKEVSFKLNLQDVTSGYYKVVGRDANGDIVDISALTVGQMKSTTPGRVWNDTFGLAPEGDHFYISMQ